MWTGAETNSFIFKRRNDAVHWWLKNLILFQISWNKANNENTFLWGWCEIGFGSFSHSYFGKKYFKLTHWCKISLEDGAHQLQTGNDACLSWANFIEHINHVGIMVNATEWKIGTSSSNSNRIRFIDLPTNNLGKGMNPPFPNPVNSSIDWVL